MGRGKRWTETENTLLKEMVRQGMSIHEIFSSGRFSNRTLYAIQNQLKRLGANLTRQKKKFMTNQISKAPIADYDEILAHYVDAFNKLCEKTEFTKEELERFRIIFMAAWKYREMFRSYEEIEKVKADVERLKETVAQLLAGEKSKEVPERTQ
ncbi:MAG: hypothetical protein QW146_08535 [Candidatus Bathyarchaeia archaeon]